MVPSGGNSCRRMLLAVKSAPMPVSAWKGLLPKSAPVRCQQRGEKSHFRQDKMSHFRRVKVSHFGPQGTPIRVATP